jgi:DNA-binding NtrC family response regulator
LRPLSILIAEPTSVFTKLLVGSLEGVDDFPIIAHVAQTFSAVTECLGKDRYDAVILNLNLPDHPTEKIFDEVMKLVPETAIIVTTSSSEMLLAAEAVKKGAQDYLFKPDITPVLLRKTILFAVERKKLQVAAAEREKLMLARLKLFNRNRSQEGWSHPLHTAIEHLVDGSSTDSFEADLENIRKALTLNGISGGIIHR